MNSGQKNPLSLMGETKGRTLVSERLNVTERAKNAVYRVLILFVWKMDENVLDGAHKFRRPLVSTADLNLRLSLSIPHNHK